MIEPMHLNLSWTDYLAILAIVTVVVVVFDFIKQDTRKEELRGELDRQLAPIERKLNALLKQQGIELTAPQGSSAVSPELLKLAATPGKMAEAIELYRKLCPGAGPVEAKAVIEVLAKSQAAPPPTSHDADLTGLKGAPAAPPEAPKSAAVVEKSGSSAPPPAKPGSAPAAPKGVSTINPELLRLATTPGKKSEAIAFYQALCPGAGVAEAAAVIEVLAKPDPPPAKPGTGPT